MFCCYPQVGDSRLEIKTVRRPGERHEQVVCDDDDDRQDECQSNTYDLYGTLKEEDAQHKNSKNRLPTYLPTYLTIYWYIPMKHAN